MLRCGRGAGGPLNDFPRGFTYSFWASIVPNAVWDGKGRGYILKTELAASYANQRADSTFVHLGPTTIPGILITLRSSDRNRLVLRGTSKTNRLHWA